MINKQIYPKTKRIPLSSAIYVTEKIDGSNLGLFNLNDKLYIAQRGLVFSIDEIEEVKSKMYKGLYAWLKENAENIKLNNNSCIFGEWLGMGQIKYGEIFNEKLLMFAKANVDDEFNVTNLNYDHSLFKYSFINQERPTFIGIVPIAAVLNKMPTKEELDKLYLDYSNLVNRKVEGLIINFNNNILKYVRFKNGKEEEHHE
nr:MAG TPA: ligase [Caudoviricetes sp.]